MKFVSVEQLKQFFSHFPVLKTTVTVTLELVKLVDKILLNGLS